MQEPPVVGDVIEVDALTEQVPWPKSEERLPLENCELRIRLYLSRFPSLPL